MDYKIKTNEEVPFSVDLIDGEYQVAGLGRWTSFKHSSPNRVQAIAGFFECLQKYGGVRRGTLNTAEFWSEYQA